MRQWRTLLSSSPTSTPTVPSQPDRFVSVDLDDVASKLRQTSRLLQQVDIRCNTFGNILSTCGEGDVVYADPPYLPETATAFTGYAATTDDWRKPPPHRLLAVLAREAAIKGARVVVSNSLAAAPIFEAELAYDPRINYVCDVVSAQRSIGVGKGSAVKRRQDEILVTVSPRA